eukprot:364685-Chlamydomonas_euryale.AAC.13
MKAKLAFKHLGHRASERHRHCQGHGTLESAAARFNLVALRPRCPTGSCSVCSVRGAKLSSASTCSQHLFVIVKLHHSWLLRGFSVWPFVLTKDPASRKWSWQQATFVAKRRPHATS